MDLSTIVHDTAYTHIIAIGWTEIAGLYYKCLHVHLCIGGPSGVHAWGRKIKSKRWMKM